MTYLEDSIHGPIAAHNKPLVPQSAALRKMLREAVSAWAARQQVQPPVTLGRLEQWAGELEALHGFPPEYRQLLMVCLGNSIWRERVASVPFSRRILLLPQCLRDRSVCPAKMDAFGLLCEGCGRCVIGRLQQEAEDLGMIVLIAEGTTVVTHLLETGTVECVIGVGCLSSLERSWPKMEAGAIPGIAVPLHKEGCDRTEVDMEWLREIIHLRGEPRAVPRWNLAQLRTQTAELFTRENLERRICLHRTSTEIAACDWMAAGGKRWRPLLTAAVYRALTGITAWDQTVSDCAVAVECFHKASLIHDDIEDADDERDGRPALHVSKGLPAALNIGDFLIGEGYRLLAEMNAKPEQKTRLLQIAARGHRDLCLGQGEELTWTSRPEPLTLESIIGFYLLKTVPAFRVALLTGAAAGGAPRHICDILIRFSEALGIAYQIRDDITDSTADGANSDLEAGRPSLFLGLALDRANGSARQLFSLIQAGRQQGLGSDHACFNEALREDALSLLAEWKQKAFAALDDLDHPELKQLLFQLVHRVLKNDAGEISEEGKPVEAAGHAG